MQVAALSAEEFGQLQHEYVVAFAEHLLLRTAPLHTPTADDDRLVKMTMCRRFDHCSGLVLMSSANLGKHFIPNRKLSAERLRQSDQSGCSWSCYSSSKAAPSSGSSLPLPMRPDQCVAMTLCRPRVHLVCICAPGPTGRRAGADARGAAARVPRPGACTTRTRHAAQRHRRRQCHCRRPAQRGRGPPVQRCKAPGVGPGGL